VFGNSSPVKVPRTGEKRRLCPGLCKCCRSDLQERGANRWGPMSWEGASNVMGGTSLRLVVGPVGQIYSNMCCGQISGQLRRQLQGGKTGETREKAKNSAVRGGMCQMNVD